MREEFGLKLFPGERTKPLKSGTVPRPIYGASLLMICILCGPARAIRNRSWQYAFRARAPRCVQTFSVKVKIFQYQSVIFYIYFIGQNLSSSNFSLFADLIYCPATTPPPLPGRVGEHRQQCSIVGRGRVPGAEAATHTRAACRAHSRGGMRESLEGRALGGIGEY
jgi:hypothetical protein